MGALAVAEGRLEAVREGGGHLLGRLRILPEKALEAGQQRECTPCVGRKPRRKKLKEGEENNCRDKKKERRGTARLADLLQIARIQLGDVDDLDASTGACLGARLGRLRRKSRAQEDKKRNAK